MSAEEKVRVAGFDVISPDAAWGKFTVTDPTSRTDGHPDTVLLNISLLHALGYPETVTLICHGGDPR